MFTDMIGHFKFESAYNTGGETLTRRLVYSAVVKIKG